MKKRIKHLIDIITIWAINRFHIQLPDLLREQQPRPGRLYYYYGRWLRLQRHNAITRRRISDFCNQHNMHLLDMPDNALAQAGMLDEKIRLQNSLHDMICTSCPLLIIGLPCRKVYTDKSRKSDLCLQYHYKIIKGKNHAEEDITQ